MTNNYIDFVEKYSASIQESTSKEHISVLVLGPSINSTEPSALLRKYIFDQLNKDQHIAVKGEHQSLIQVFKDAKGDVADLCHYELTLAQEVQALVIIPSSPGSWIEVGMFSLVESICEKSLVLFDGNYEKPDDNFVHQGARKAFDNRGASTEFIDYTEKEQAWSLASEYVQNKRNNKSLRERLAS